MAERQTKGFYQDMEGQEVFEIKKDEKKSEVLNESGLMLEIGAEKIVKSADKIYLAKQKTFSRLSGIWWKDIFLRMNDYMVEHTKVKVKDLATAFRLLAVMINAGLPLIKSLNTLGVQSEKNPKLARVLFELAGKIEGGKSLSSSMEEFPEVFSESQIGAIAAGEASGQLNKSLRTQAEELEKVSKIQSKVKGALVYPVAILTIMTAVIFVMMIFVVPQISQLFTSSGKTLPLPTLILINTSNFLVAYWYIILIIVGATVFGVSAWKKTKIGHYYWDNMMISLPVFGNLVKKSALSKFAHSFGNLLGSGVPIIRALEVVANGVGNEVYKKRFLMTAQDMKGGIPMAENLSNSKLFPTMLVNMIEIGEQTAQLENVCQKVADFYDDEVDAAVTALTKVMEPLVIVIVGIVVGGLVAAIMLPIIHLTVSHSQIYNHTPSPHPELVSGSTLQNPKIHPNYQKDPPKR